MRTVVVTGASGFLGQRVVRLLAARHDVGRVVAIDVVPVGVEAPSVDARILDLAQEPSLRADPLDVAIDGADSAVHLAWSTSDSAAPAPSPNLRSLRRLLGASERAGLTSLVYLSSATVYGAWPDNQIPLSENAPIRPNPGFGFAIEKAEAERVVAEWSDEHPAVVDPRVLRPAVTVGAAGPPLYRALSGTSGPRSEDTARPMQFLHVDDLAEAVVTAWEQRLEGVYNVAPDHGVGEDTARALAGGVARLTLPSRLAKAVAAWSWQLWRTGTPKEALPYASNPWVIAGDKLKAAGWTPRHTSEEALVSADNRAHWSDLPTSRRQEVLLLAGLALLSLVVIGLPAAAVALYRHRRRASIS